MKQIFDVFKTPTIGVVYCDNQRDELANILKDNNFSINAGNLEDYNIIEFDKTGFIHYEKDNSKRYQNCFINFDMFKNLLMK